MSSEKRFYDDIKNIFAGEDSRNNRLVYEYSNIVPKQSSSDLLFGITTIYPGDIDGEFFMTKGHYHEIDAAEVYYCISGNGTIYQQNRFGDEKTSVVCPGDSVYIEPGYGHRAINTGDTPFVFFCACRADAGHDYEIEFKNRFYKGN